MRPAITADDLRLCRAALSSTLHLRVRNPRSRRWSTTAACGRLAWTQDELDAQLRPAPRLAGVEVNRRCADSYCIALWGIYDRGRER